MQVTETLPVLVQVQPPLDGFTDTNVTPAGRVSVTLTLAASDGPWLATSTCTSRCRWPRPWPGRLLTMDRSADAVTVVFDSVGVVGGVGVWRCGGDARGVGQRAAWSGAVTTIVMVVRRIPLPRWRGCR